VNGGSDPDDGRAARLFEWIRTGSTRGFGGSGPGMPDTRPVIVIRRSVMGDISELRDVEVDAGQMFRSVGLDVVAEDDPPTAEAIAEHIGRATAWTAVLDSAVAGYVLASVVDGEGHLDQVSVRRAAAGRGIGSRLIDQVCRWAAGEGYDAVSLTTFVEVPWNGPYYERLGFRALEDASCGPQLMAIRQAERRSGIEAAPRTAMRIRLTEWVSPALA
jgi:GNAT superfamily N-acetyltransferase